MKKTKDITKTQTPITEAPVETTPKVAKPAKKGTPANEQPARKTQKAAKAETDGEVTDRLPGTLDELKETKGGFVAYQFLAGKDRDTIAKDLATAFKLADAQALKITRRITGRVRLYQRVFELLAAKKA